jgi:hypothetical protein
MERLHPWWAEVMVGGLTALVGAVLGRAVAPHSPDIGTGLGAALGVCVTVFFHRRYVKPLRESEAVNENLIHRIDGLQDGKERDGREIARLEREVRDRFIASSLVPGAKAVDVSCSIDYRGPPATAVLGITNNGETADFEAQVIAWGNKDDLSRATAVRLKWVGGAEKMTIGPGITEYLQIASIERREPPPVRPDVKGSVTVQADWVYLGVLMLGVFGGSVSRFGPHVWSIHVVVSSGKASAPFHQGVRIHVFDRAVDDPTGKLAERGWEPETPIMRLSLFDIQPSG